MLQRQPQDLKNLTYFSCIVVLVNYPCILLRRVDQEGIFSIIHNGFLIQGKEYSRRPTLFSTPKFFFSNTNKQKGLKG